MIRIVHGVESVQAGDLIDLDHELLRVLDRDGPRLHVIAAWPFWRAMHERPRVIRSIRL